MPTPEQRRAALGLLEQIRERRQQREPQTQFERAQDRIKRGVPAPGDSVLVKLKPGAKAPRTLTEREKAQQRVAEGVSAPGDSIFLKLKPPVKAPVAKKKRTLTAKETALERLVKSKKITRASADSLIAGIKPEEPPKKQRARTVTSALEEFIKKEASAKKAFETAEPEVFDPDKLTPEETALGEEFRKTPQAKGLRGLMQTFADSTRLAVTAKKRGFKNLNTFLDEKNTFEELLNDYNSIAQERGKDIADAWLKSANKNIDGVRHLQIIVNKFSGNE